MRENGRDLPKEFTREASMGNEASKLIPDWWTEEPGYSPMGHKELDMAEVT